ncbi:hypothetical protein [Specibacter sp. NPDC078709]|uniref:hypothetical protein n=1 Tax=Specibacter sp. NPDC078709 TaxID=3154364 RepID=UPI003417E399
MSDKPVLLFLHGVGDGDPDGKWKAALEQSLTRSGYPSLDEATVIAPRYAHALEGFDAPEPLPARTFKALSRDAAKLNRRDFERRLAAVEHRIGRQDQEHRINEAVGNGAQPVHNATADAVVAMPFFQQAANYLDSKQIRAQVLNRILAKVPESGRIIIVAHSLGSVVAADLLLRLPVDVEVSAMITIGSPLANGRFKLEGLRDSLVDPPVHLSWWVNFRNAWDPVAIRRGLSSSFPWLLDHRINTGPGLDPVTPHTASVYLNHSTVAATIGYALFGSQSKEIALLERGVDIALNDAESKTLLGLRYCHLVKNELSGDTRRRYLAALRSVQAQAVSDLRAHNKSINRPLPSQLGRLDFDYADETSLLPEPTFNRKGTSKEEAATLLTAVAATNVLAPFEITVSKDVEQAALEELASEMGLMRQFGSDVLEAGKRAQGILRDSQNLQWVKVGALLAGTAALVVGTGGLALAAGPGLAGAAVVTSALASFGPGGMIGGLITAGALVGGGGLLAGSGGGTMVTGLAGDETSVDQLEGFIALQLAAVILRQQHKIDTDPGVWQLLTEIEIRVSRQHERLDEISDKKAGSVATLAKKRTIVGRALSYLSDNGLEPGGPEKPEPLPKAVEKRGARFIPQLQRAK